MFLLLPTPVINSITDQEEDTTISLIPITFASVLSIDEDKETGFAIIKYHSGSIVNTKFSFVRIMQSLSEQNAVNYIGTLECQKISKPFSDYCKSLNFNP